MRTWSTPALLVLCTAGAVLLGGTALFLAALFLHSAPSNALSKQYRAELDAVVYPEFEQNWRLFAPNPLQQNVTVDARVQTIAADGTVSTREWAGLTAGDIAAVRHNPAPSHVDQNLLRRALDFYDSTHAEQQVIGPRAGLAEQYLKRVALQRLGPADRGLRLFQVQLRVGTAELAPPEWSREQVDTEPKYRELPWWPVGENDLRGLW
ncbi:hypothetical protein F4556_003444 [Kitasatospora gansuensis]|uniref:Uncharacterized protein n=1 Tax=Kitasatospora gansuensis TaxID=258050 RepID=A0A7W7WIU0_9ACTN|nr:DUF5819 family protein [Kitasatospora gansuensis]MBB4947909.1 hypothetical protein [Kitasatospora gansuensis]